MLEQLKKVEYKGHKMDTFDGAKLGAAAEKIIFETLSIDLEKRGYYLQETSKELDLLGIDAFMVKIVNGKPPEKMAKSFSYAISMTSTWKPPGMNKDLIRVAIGNIPGNLKDKNIFNMPVDFIIYYVDQRKEIFVFSMPALREFIIKKFPEIKHFKEMEQLVNKKPNLFVEDKKRAALSHKIYLRKSGNNYDLIYYANLDELSKYLSFKGCRIYCPPGNVVEKYRKQFGIKD